MGELVTSKPSFRSKTLWANVLMALAAFSGPGRDFLAANPNVLPIVFMVANVILRAVTKDKITLI